MVAPQAKVGLHPPGRVRYSCVVKKKVYVETSVISYLASRTSRGVLTLAMQKMTADWWSNRRWDFDVYVSELVFDESRRGDADAVRRRMVILKEIGTLAVNDSVTALAKKLVAEGALPTRAVDDAMHVALAAAHGMDYLLTWNCRHIDNAELKPLIRSVCAIAGYSCPEICSPQELMEGHAHD